MTRGMLLGKFMPPHLGHVYLCEFARGCVDDLTVVVCSIQREPIPGELRFRWMRELLPDVRVVHLTEELPQDPSEHPRFWDLWTDALARILPASPDFVFASEPYGARLAQVQGATFIPVDIGRGAVPTSGTAIRTDPMANWAYIPRCVRPYFARRVCVFGPESTGKSTLARRLAAQFSTTCVPEYARTHLEARGEGPVLPADIERIARCQIASEEALARNANRVLVADTDVLLTSIWSRVLHGDCPAWIDAEAARRSFDLYLLTDVDVPWVADPVRYLPDERRSFFDRCERELQRLGRPYVVVRGSWEERWETARKAVAQLIA